MRNPDALELARGKAARVLGDLTGLLALLRGLPAGYSKDLQEDKAFLFDAVDTVMLTLPAVRGLVETLEPVPERMSGALDPAMLATDAADELAARGVPFREAHALVGQAVRMAEALGVTLSEMPSDAAAEVHPALPGVLASLGTWSESIERRSTTGGSSRRSVMEQITALEEVFGK
jgi:argininosuccinate lyase